MFRAEDRLVRVLLLVDAESFLVSAAAAAAAGFLYSGGVSTFGVSRLLLRRGGEVLPIDNPRERRLGRLDATLALLPASFLLLEAAALDDALLRRLGASSVGILVYRVSMCARCLNKRDRMQG